jgi:hypothetical protein
MAKKEMPEHPKITLQPGDIDRKEPADGVTMQEDWHELVRRIQEEKDTHKLMSLVQELICKFDEEKLRKSMHRPGGHA